MSSDLAKQLDDLASKLFNVFSKEYMVQVHSNGNPSNDSGENVTVNNYNTYNNYYGNRWSDPYWVWPGSFWGREVHHHHYNSNLRRRGAFDKDDDSESEDEKKKEEREKQEDFKNKLLGTIIISGASVVATWVFSKDGFVGLWRYSVENDVNSIDIFNLRHGNNQQVGVAITKCKEWLDQYRSRVKKPFYAKLGMFGSGLGMGASFFFNVPYMFFGSVLAGTASGCYYLWNKWGWYDMDKEARLFFEMMSQFKKAQTGLTDLAKEDDKDEKEGMKNEPKEPKVESLYPDLDGKKVYDLVSD
jgi:hypothetical protein